MTQNRLIVRYRHGTPIYPALDLRDILKQALEHVEAGDKLQNLIKPISDGKAVGEFIRTALGFVLFKR